MMSGPPFAAQRHQIGREPGGGQVISAVPFPPHLAPHMGASFAAIDPWASYPYPASALASYLAGEAPEAPRFLLSLSDAPIGAVGVRLELLRGPYVQFLGILPAHAGKGLGGLVLGWIEKQARQGTARNLWVCASDFNAGALRFYMRHGFETVAHLDDLVQDGRTEVLLRKRLA